MEPGDSVIAPPFPAGATRGRRGAYGKVARRAAVWDLGAALSSQGIMFFISIFVSRLLTPADFGVTAAARFFITLASRATQLGLNVSLVRMKEVRQEHVSSVFVTNLVAGLLAFGTLALASPVLGRFFNSPDVGKVLPLSATVFLVVPFSSVASAMMDRHLQYRIATMIQWCDVVGGSLVSLVLAWLGYGYWSLVIGALVATIGSASAKVWFSPWRPSLRVSMPALRDTLSFGIGFQAKRLLAFSTSNLDNVVVGRVLGVVSLGFYDKAYGLMNQVTNRMAFDDTLMRIFSIIREEPDRFRRAIIKGAQATSIVTFPVLMFSAVTADRLIVVLFGQQWVPAVGPFQVLAVTGMLRSVRRPVSAAGESLGLVWIQAGMQGLSVVLMVVGVAIGAHWGLMAGAVGVLAADIANYSMSVWLLTRYSTVRWIDLWRSAWPSLATAVALAIIVTAVNVALGHVSVNRDGLVLTADVVTAAIAYPALLLWTPYPSIAAVLLETVDDLAPWLRRYVRLGVLRTPAASADALAAVATDR